MSLTLSVFSLDIGGAERVLRRSIISDDSLGAYLTMPDAALGAMSSLGGTRPDGFRITDDRGCVRISHTKSGRRHRASA